LQQTRNFAAAPPAKKSMGKGGGKVKKVDFLHICNNDKILVTYLTYFSDP
jgi:hypothetical protein